MVDKTVEIEGKTPKLTPREQKFFHEYIERGSITESYLVISPNVKRDSAMKAGHKMLKRIKEKTNWEGLLSEAGLGEERLLMEIEHRLTAKKTEFYQGEPVAQVEDNTTRMRATELLADILGVRKRDVEVEHTHKGHIVLIPAEAKDVDEWMRTVHE